jgi:carboxypeptidase C (cathepsin A)
MKHGAVILLLALVLSASAASAAAGPRDRQSPDRPSEESRSGERRARGSPSQPGEDTRDTMAAPRRSAAVPECSVTDHTMLVQGRPIRYRAAAGYLPIQRDSDKPIAHIFFVAYERLDGGQRTEDRGQRTEDRGQTTENRAVLRDPSSVLRNRPITFAFNGGPGASAVWLHMGAFGPKRAVLANDGTALPPSDQLVDNEHTWLEFTDLVFVDPVGTGFSRAAAGVDADQFYEVQKDIEVAADFVRLFVTQRQRWLSPQFLVGESYGTIRAVGMARRLQDRYGLYVNGLILLSSALNLGVISFDPGNDLPYALSLPSYTAVAQHHGKLRERSSSGLPAPGPEGRLRPLLRVGERSLQRVQEWALGDYLAALAQGRLLSPTESREIARRLAEYTGLQEDMIVQNRLRIGTAGFAQGLLSRENRVLGLLDGRVTAPNVQLLRRPWIDPSLFLVEGPFVATFNSYVRTQLGFQTDRPYIFLSDKANESWNWGPGRQGYLNVAPILAEAIGLDNRLRVFAAAGYYDLTTPYLSQEYVFNHLGLPPELEQNITFRHYHAGHQIYTSQDALRQLTDDVRTFVTETP